jgi:hypothetical protein
VFAEAAAEASGPLARAHAIIPRNAIHAALPLIGR